MTPDGHNCGIAIFDGSDEAGLAAALASPATICMEARYTDDATPWPGAVLLLRLSTATAVRLDVADVFTSALEARLPHLNGLVADIRYAVQEAIGNAVIHGNLGLDSAMRATLDDLHLFAAIMEQRLGNPAHAHLPVTILARPHRGGIAISVEDRGAGFQPGTTCPQSSAAGGLGLTIIRKCCRRMRHSRGGRRLTMLFG